MTSTLSNLLRKRAEAHPDFLPRVLELSLQIEQLSKNSRSLRSYVVPPLSWQLFSSSRHWIGCGNRCGFIGYSEGATIPLACFSSAPLG